MTSHSGRHLLGGILVLALLSTTAAQPGEPVAGGLTGRAAKQREQLLKDHGGNAASEAAVALGLRWLALHQANDGSWSLNEYNKTTREKPLGTPGKVFEVIGGDKDKGAQENKVAATAFALLAFLGAGHTQKAIKDNEVDTSKTVRGSLDWLLKSQGKDGSFGGGMYAHAAATIAVGEAYGLTGDPLLKAATSNALKFIVASQHDGGGWRYAPKQEGDLSVTSWMLAALRTGELAGLPTPKDTLVRVDKFLDATYDEKANGFRYTPNVESISPSMTAAGMLDRLGRGVNPRSPAIVKGIEVLKKQPPAAAMKNLYYAYYATQALYHGGSAVAWDNWNLGPDGTGKDGLRDLLVQAQDKGDNPKKAFQAGSWAPSATMMDGGSRMISTSLSLLMLEVYYRHLPLSPRPRNPE